MMFDLILQPEVFKVFAGEFSHFSILIVKLETLLCNLFYIS